MFPEIESKKIPEKIKFNPGEKVEVTNGKHSLYGQEVHFVRDGGEIGGIWVKRPNEETEYYLARGFEKVKK